MNGDLILPVLGGAGVLAGLGIAWAVIWGSLYRKVGPNEVLIISGRKHRIPETGETIGFRVVKGGGTLVIPILERVDVMSLELITLDIVTPEMYTRHGVPIKVDGVAQIKVKGDDVSIRTAAEQFLSKTRDEILSVAMQTVAGHLRAILGTMTVEELMASHEAFAQKVTEVAAADLANMGLEIVSFTIREITDSHGYLNALGKPRTAQVLRDAAIGEAEAKRDSTIRSAQAEQEAQMAKFQADTRIAEAERDYKLKVQEFTAIVNAKKAETDLAYDLQKFKTAQMVKQEEIQVQLVEKKKQTEVQEQEILRREKELIATVLRPADAERQRIQMLAEAEQFRLRTTALGQADAQKAEGLARAEVIRAQGQAEADAAKARGLAEAEVIRAQGEAEAEAMAKKAEAWRQYNEAALLQLFFEKLPELAKAIAEPLSKVEKVVIVSSDGEGLGASRLTGEVTRILSQLPPVVEAITGIKIQDLAQRVPTLGNNPPKDQQGQEPKETQAGKE